MTTNSGYRCPAGNRNTGSEATTSSFHMAGRTVDISTTVNALANEELCDRLAENYNGRNGGYPVSSRMIVAMDLALVLQDEALQAKVIALSKDEKTLLKRGAKQEWLSEVEAHVNLRLAGRPALIPYNPDPTYNYVQALREAILDLDK